MIKLSSHKVFSWSLTFPSILQNLIAMAIVTVPWLVWILLGYNKGSLKGKLFVESFVSSGIFSVLKKFNVVISENIAFIGINFRDSNV